MPEALNKVENRPARDIDDLCDDIHTGIYGDDRMTSKDRDVACNALRDLAKLAAGERLESMIGDETDGAKVLESIMQCRHAESDEQTWLNGRQWRNLVAYLEPRLQLDAGAELERVRTERDAWKQAAASTLELLEREIARVETIVAARR